MSNQNSYPPQSTPPQLSPIQIYPDDPLSQSSQPSPPVTPPRPDENDHYWSSQGLPTTLTGYRKSAEEINLLRKRKAQKVARFYENQNEMIDTLLEPIVQSDDEDDTARDNLKVSIAINGSFGVNIVLLVLQCFAAISSGALSLFATMTDSFMDLLSNLILFVTNRAMKKRDVNNYPTGKNRMETVGVIVFSSLMSTVSVQLMIEGVKALLAKEHPPPSLSPIDIAFIGVALACKFGLFLYCRTLRSYSNACKTLAQDHRNDLLVNSFGLTMSILGDKLAWWWDPIGALVIALIILRSWIATAWENTQLLLGRSAPPSILNRITYISATHDPRIVQVDTVKAYYLGSKLYVEVDVVLPPDMKLKESHDIGESLQVVLEGMKNVERAYVHVDYESLHRPEHKEK
ncbi:putative cation efflux pump [Paraphysoderma sedebokerense]|nr:putative cation efflux pump [Paraphysoderma sedebokerense]